VFEGAQEVQLQGTLLSVEEVGAARKKRLVAVFKDDTGTIELIWFKGAKWIKSSLAIGEKNT